MDGALIAGRFRVLGTLGTGGAGSVYRALDLVYGGRVALKLLGDSSAALFELLRREFEHLRRARHPHLVDVLDFGFDRERQRAYYTSRIVEGERLDAFARGKRWPEARQPFVDALEALAHLHALGLRHGDFKPANVLVAPTGRGTLLDLSASARLDAREIVAMGTPGYLGPELARGRADERSDLYAVGVVLGELLDLVEGAPKSLHKLHARLTAPEPEARPASVDETLTLLGAKPESRARSIPHSFVGRGRELAAGLELLSGLERGEGPQVLLVRGDSGLGKSALLTELVANAQPRMTVVTCDALRPDPFAALTVVAGAAGAGDRLDVLDALRDLEARNEPLLVVVDDADRLGTDGRRLLAALLASATPGHRVGVLLSERRASVEVPHSAVVLELGPISDSALAEWLAPHLSPELLREVLRLAHGSPRIARALGAMAASGGAGPERLRRPAAELGDGASLSGLEPEALELLAAAVACSGLLDEATLATLSTPPSAIARLLGHGWLEPRGAGFRSTRPWSRSALAAELGRAAWQKLNQRLAAAFAASAGAAPAGSAEAATALSRQVALRLAAGARTIPATELEACEELAERWPEAFSSLDDAFDATTASPDLLLGMARLALAAGDAERALARVTQALARRPAAELRTEARELAGACYAALGNPRAAVRSFGRATLQASTPSRRARVAHALAVVYSKQGKNREAHATASAALAQAEGAALVDLLCDVAQADAYLGEVARARDDLERAHQALERATETGARFGRASARLSAVRGLVALRTGDGEAAGRAYEAMLATALEHRLDDLVAFAAMNYGAVCHQQGAWATALDAYARGLRSARARGLRSAEARCLYNSGVLHFELGQDDLAETELSQAHELADKERLPFVAGAALLVLGEHAARAESPERAHAFFGRARATLEACGAERELCELDVETAALSSRTGDLGQAELLLERAARRSSELDADDLRARVGWARALLCLAKSRPDDALAKLEPALAIAERIGHHLLCVKLETLAAEAAERAGSPALGERYSRRARERWERLTVGLPEAVRARRAPRAPSALQTARRTDDELDWRRILAVYRRLSTAATPREVLRETLDAAIELSHAERGFLIVVERQRGGRTLSAPVARNIDREALEKPQLKFSRSIAESVIESGTPLVTVDAEHDPRFSDKRSVHALQLRSVLCVPIVASSGVLGSIYLDNRFRTGGFGARETELVGLCAEQAALALEKARLLEDLESRTRALEAERQRVEELMARQADEIRELSEELDRQRDTAEPEGMVGTTDAMRRVYALLDRVADTDVSALVTGESGTGKELVARAIHRKSARARGPFSAVNCGALPESLLEAELFGYRKGAFTGASQDREGLFVAARGGSVFLDEIGEMPLSMQVKLLRVLQEREVKPLGSERSVPIDVRILCATNRDLSREVREGRFREDLYYRIAVVEIPLPPLRARKDDLPALVRTLLARTAAELRRPTPRIAPDALHALTRHDWPGNVRELQNVLSRAAVLCSGEVITARDLGLGATAGGPRGRERGFDAQALERALRESGMNATRAARSLGIGRATLYRWAERAGIDLGERRSARRS